MNQFLRYAQKAALGLAAGVFLTGCFENDFLTPYEGPDVVEFDQVAGGYTITAIEGDDLYELRVNLIAPQRGTATEIEVAVVDSLTTGDEGTLFEFPEGRTVTIPANSSFGTLPIRILNNSVESNGTRTIGLELVGSSDGTVTGADNLDDFLFTVLSKRLQFTTTSATVVENDTTITAPISIIGKAEDVALTATVEVVEVVEDSVAYGRVPRAVEGTHYTFPAGTQFTIPAGTRTAGLPIRILDNSLNEGETVRLVIRIVGTTDGRILGDTETRTFTLTINGAEDEDDGDA